MRIHLIPYTFFNFPSFRNIFLDLIAFVTFFFGILSDSFGVNFIIFFYIYIYISWYEFLIIVALIVSLIYTGADIFVYIERVKGLKSHPSQLLGGNNFNFLLFLFIISDLFDLNFYYIKIFIILWNKLIDGREFLDQLHILFT